MPLLLSVITLVTLGAISFTGFALARAERQAGQAALARVQAKGAAEAALAEAFAGWPVASTPMVPGVEVPIAALVVSGPARGSATLRSLGGPVYALRSKGFRRDLAGNAIGFAELELLVLLDSAGPDSIARPRAYPRGLRILP